MNAAVLVLTALLQDPPESFSDTLVVTASGDAQRIVDAVAPTTVLTREELERAPDLTLDDRLRQVPGFGLLRRSSSLTAHPTTQGVSLRGLGPSGASRTLVLFDGAPLNDPFGGWVYWNRLPSSALESVEVSRGSLSQLYGSSAMGGAIQLLPRWELRAAWLYTDSRVERTGLRVPQVPFNQGSFGIAFDGPVTALLQARWAGDQFEDDLNQLPLPSYEVVDLSLRRAIRERFEVFLAAENLFDEDVVTGRTPIETFGAPRMVQIGLTVHR